MSKEELGVRLPSDLLPVPPFEVLRKRITVKPQSC